MNARPRSQRVFLIYAALVCLCVSDGVGPRLVPYPAAKAARLTRVAPAKGSLDRPAFIADNSNGSSHRAGEASDSLNKLPVHYAPPLTSSQSTPEGYLDFSLTPGRHLPSPVSLRHGRAPPRTA